MLSNLPDKSFRDLKKELLQDQKFSSYKVIRDVLQRPALIKLKFDSSQDLENYIGLFSENKD